MPRSWPNPSGYVSDHELPNRRTIGNRSRKRANIERLEAHIFVAFLAYCLYVTLARRLNPLAPGLTARSVIEKFAAVQMIDLHVPTTDGHELRLTRYTEPEPELRLILDATSPVIWSFAVPEAELQVGRATPGAGCLAGSGGTGTLALTEPKPEHERRNVAA